MADFWTLVADFGFWTEAAVFGFLDPSGRFWIWILVADFGRI